MSELKLGQIITDQNPQRDAIHVAVAPVVAAEKLSPGQDIGFVGEDTTRVGATASKLIGIVDPYLKALVYPEQPFWMFLYPQTITSLRHDWTHPAFMLASVPTIDSAKQWLIDFADNFDLTYDGLMRAAESYLEHGDYITEHGSEAWRDEFWQKEDEFWNNYEAVTGKRVENRGNFFSCSC